MFPGGMPDLNELLQQATMMQQQLASAQEELANTEVTGTSGGGLVTATLSGSGELRALEISPEAVDPADTETLADLVIAAVHDASNNVKKLSEEKLGPLNESLQGMGGGIPGGMPGGGIPGLPGQGGTPGPAGF